MQSGSDHSIDDWPLLILLPVRLFAQHSNNLIQCLLLASPVAQYHIYSETFHLPQPHLPISDMVVCISIHAAGACSVSIGSSSRL